MRAHTVPEDELTRLSHCRTVIEIKEWAIEAGINLRQDITIGSTVLHHLLAQDQEAIGVHEIAAYICDPTFHSPGSSFILESMRAMVLRSWTPESWDVLRRSIGSATELGLISVADIKDIVTEVLGARSLQWDAAGVRGWGKGSRNKARLYMVHGIVESLDRCAVLQVSDLGTPLLQKLFSRFATKTFWRWSKDMVWLLLPWAGKNYVPFIARLTLYPLEVQRDEGTGGKFGQELADRLLRADSEVLQLLVPYTTERLLLYTRETNLADYRFMWHHWCSTLAILGSASGKVSLTVATWNLLQQTESTLSSDQRYLAFAWTATYLSHELRTSTALSDWIQFLDEFEKLVATLPRPTMDPSQLVVEVGSLALPNKQILLHNLTRLSACRDDLPSFRVTYSKVQQGVTPSMLDSKISHAHLGHSDALAEMLHNSTYGYPAFKVLSRRMIHKNTASFGIVCRHLEVDTGLKIALQMSRTQKVPSSQTKALNKSDYVYFEIGAQKVQRFGPPSRAPTTSTLPTRDEIVDLINDIAISFATSPVATARAALRRVYWCYLFLHRQRLPIPPTITRALWYAGVTRYLEEGTPATLMKWLLARVREVEGANVANHLFWSDSFRTTRAEQLAASSRLTKAEEHAVQAMLRGREQQTPPRAGNRASDSEESEPQHKFVAPLPTSGRFFSSAEIESCLTGDPRADAETKRKIAFLESQPPDKPFWVPGVDTARDEEEPGTVGKDRATHVLPGQLGQWVRFDVRPLGLLGKTAPDSDRRWWQGDAGVEYERKDSIV